MTLNNTSQVEINFLDYWKIILKYKKMITTTIVVISVLAVIVSLVLPKTYKANALIIPVSASGNGGGLSGMLSQLGGMASLAGISLPGGSGENQKIMTILTSRTLAENVVNNENLMPELFWESWDEKTAKWKDDEQPSIELAVNKLRASIFIKEDKETKAIEISGVFRRPELAARVVNAYLRELQQFINDNAFTMAKRNRLFIENQLEQNKEDLLVAGKEINEFYSGKSVSSADARVDVPVTSSKVKIHISGDVSLPNEQSFLSDRNIHFKNPILSEAQANTTEVDSKISDIIAKKTEIEKKIAHAKTVKDVPQQVYLAYLMLRRELLIKVNALLTSQYEMAKIEEAKDELAFQIIDKAVAPLKRYRPRRTQICIMSFFGAFFIAVFIAFFREYLQRMKKSLSH